MKNTLKILLFISFFSYSQEKTKIYTIDDKIFSLGQREKRFDSLTKKSYDKTINRFKEKIKNEKIPDSIGKYLLKIENWKFTRFKENNAVLNLKKFENNLEKDYDFSSYTGEKSAECRCELEDKNKINISISGGLWEVFNISIIIEDVNSYSTYSEYRRRTNIYSERKSDTILHRSIKVNNLKSNLQLNNKPIFQIGENLIGKLSFESNNFFQSKNWKKLGAERFDKYKKKEKDTISILGEVNFKCQLKENQSLINELINTLK